MPEAPSLLHRLVHVVMHWIRIHFAQFMAARAPILWFLAVLAGLGGAGLGLGFRWVIGFIQSLWIGTSSEFFLDKVAELPFWMIVLAPTLGGLAIGLITWLLGPNYRRGSVADAIEARIKAGDNLSLRKGLVGGLISAITLGSGGSAGREGPVVHLAATFSKLLLVCFNLPPASRRIILAAGVAAAIAASFNAPIAGVLFAHEVILAHFAMTAFVPLVISATVAALVSRAVLGDISAFIIPDFTITSAWEFPAFALLGLTCAIVAIGFQAGLIGVDYISRHIPMRRWMHPMVGGLMVGMIALIFPQILGVGYEATDMALQAKLSIWLMIALVVAKILATSITLGFRMGGGVFSPALFLGAMTGSAFGLIATSVFPDLASSSGLYALLGMGGVGAAILGAPISTTVIIFELTGGFDFAAALLLTVAISSGLSQAFFGRSYFYWQLFTRGVILHEGPHHHYISTLKVAKLIKHVAQQDAATMNLGAHKMFLKPSDSVQTALKAFNDTGLERLPVVDKTDTRQLIGWLYHVDALRVFNKALIDFSKEANM